MCMCVYVCGFLCKVKKTTMLRENPHLYTIPQYIIPSLLPFLLTISPFSPQVTRPVVVPSLAQWDLCPNPVSGSRRPSVDKPHAALLRARPAFPIGKVLRHQLF